MNIHRLDTARIRLLVRHIDFGEFITNMVITRGLRDAILQAHAASLDGTCVAFICINEVVVGFYVRGARMDCAQMPLPPSLRALPLTRTAARMDFLPGLFVSEEARIGGAYADAIERRAS